MDLGRRLSEFWYATVVLGVVGSVWVSFAQQAGRAIITAIPVTATLVSLLLAAVLLVFGLVAKIVTVFGPVRASAADFIWRPSSSQSATQRLQIGLTVLVFVSLALLLLIVTAGYAGLPLKWIISFAAVVVGVSIAIFAGESWLQTKDMIWLGEAMSDALMVVALAVVIGAALAVPIVSSLLAGAITGLTLALRKPLSIKANARHRLQGIPRWELQRAHANTVSTKLAITDLNLEHLRAGPSSDSNTQRSPLPLRRTVSSLFMGLLARSSAHQWLRIVAPIALAVSMGMIGGKTLGSSVALLGSVVLAMMNSRFWVGWKTSDAIQRMFACTAKRPGPAIFAALLVVPGAAAFLSTVVFGFTSALVSTGFALVASAYIIIARGRVAANERSFNSLTHTILLPDIGYIPLGTIRRVTSGWLPAVASIYLFAQTNIWLGMLPLTVLLGIQLARNSR